MALYLKWLRTRLLYAQTRIGSTSPALHLLEEERRSVDSGVDAASLLNAVVSRIHLNAKVLVAVDYFKCIASQGNRGQGSRARWSEMHHFAFASVEPHSVIYAPSLDALSCLLGRACQVCAAGSRAGRGRRLWESRRRLPLPLWLSRAIFPSRRAP